jgi:hypothetical protein
MPLNLAQAKRAGEIAAQMDALNKLIAMADIAIAEGWRITIMKVRAPNEGSSMPGGTMLDLLPLYPASVENSAMGIMQAKATYQAELVNLQAALDEIENWAPPAPPQPDPVQDTDAGLVPAPDGE